MFNVRYSGRGNFLNILKGIILRASLEFHYVLGGLEQGRTFHVNYLI